MDPSYETSEGLLLALVQLMSAPHTRPLYLRAGAGNSKLEDGRAGSVADAVRSGRPFTITLRDDILALDADDEVRASEMVRDFIDEYLAEFEPVVCTSGKPGRLHLFVYVWDPRWRQHLLDAAREMGFKGSAFGKSMRPPCAPHPHGGSSALVDLTVGEAIEALRSPHEQQVRGLSRKASYALYVGSDGRPGDSRSDVVARATLGMLDAGFGLDEMWSLLLANPGGERLREELQGSPQGVVYDRWIKYTVEWARSKRASSPTIKQASDALRIVAAARLWMDTVTWKGTGGNTDRAVLSTFLDLADRHHAAHQLGLSVRTVAEAVGITYPTASKSFHRLIERGILRQVEKEADTSHHGPRANRYSITTPDFSTAQEREAWMSAIQDGVVRSSQQQSYPGGVDSTVAMMSGVDLLAHDAFRTRGLGKPKLRVWMALDLAEPCTTAMVAAAVGTKTPTVLKHLTRLQAVGLAHRDEQGRWLRLDRDLNDVARDVGTAGTGGRQKELHHQQRIENNNEMETGLYERFVSLHVRSARRWATVDQRRLRGEYYSFCAQVRHNEGPRADIYLAGEVIDKIETARFVRDTGSSNLLLRGRWAGIEIVDPPSSKPSRTERSLSASLEVANELLPRHAHSALVRRHAS